MPKKDFSSFDLHAIVHELQPKLAEARINNVYQLDDKTLLLKLHRTGEQPLMLVMDAGRRLHLTNFASEKPQTPPAFCMSMRKYLPGAKISQIEQYEFERVATIHFHTKEAQWRLILELFGEGNIILTDKNGIILQALHFKKMRDRTIARNQIYQFPPSSAKNPFKITRQELESGLQALGATEIVRGIVRLIGVGGTYAEELLLRTNVEKAKPCTSLAATDFDSIFLALQELLSSVSTKPLEPNIVLDDAGSFVDVAPFLLKRYASFKVQHFQVFSDALDEFYARVVAAEKAVAGIDVGQFKREADRLKRMVAEQELALKNGEEESLHDKAIGDAIYAHFGELQELLGLFARVWQEGKDLNSLVTKVQEAKAAGLSPCTYFNLFNGKRHTIDLTLDELQFSLDMRLNLYENANQYYDKGKLAKQKLVAVNEALADSQKKFAGLEKELSKVEALRTAAPTEAIEELETRRVQIKEWFEKFRWFRSSEGFLVVAGKDVVSNEVVVKKYTSTGDIVFHAELTGAPFTVVKAEGKQPGEATLREAGEFAVSFCRGWRESMGSVDVYWVKPEQLTSSGPSGESVPKGAFFVNGKRNWMRGTPLRIAVGYIPAEEAFIGGPVDAVKAKTSIYAVLVPGDLEGKDFLKQILRSLTLKLPKEQRDPVSKASIEAIRDFVPYTRGRIVINN
jgi:predicted ribosome quality control (RQC) complex YloA/Tae2 family protein